VNTLLVLPILIPVLTAAACLIVRNRTAQRTISITGAALLFGASIWLLREVYAAGIIVVQLGNWPAPFGITFVADLLAAGMVAVSAFVGLTVGIFALADIDEGRERYGFHALYHVLLMGVCGAFITGDLFNLFVWIEVMLMASFVLLALGGERTQIEGAVKYLTLNFVASGLFLTAIGIIYGATGTLNIADLAVRLRDESTAVPLAAAMLLMGAFGIKAGLFPLFFWLPASYHTPPVAVSAVFAGLLTKVGVYALIRVFTLIFTGMPEITHPMIIWLSVFTMLTGVLGAAAQFEIRRVLSFHIISQIGYMTLGLGFFTAAAIGAAVFYIIHHIIVKTNLFLIAGAIRAVRGTNELKQLGGLYRDYPWLGVLFLIPALSLGGVPPLSGFWAKFALVSAGLGVEQWIAIAVALFVGLLTLFSMTKIWAEAFWKAAPEGAPTGPQRAVPVLMLVPIISMALVTVLFGLFPSVLLDFSNAAAAQITNPQLYIDSVMGAQP
jgi:multicomponent Na+:H+ antiporter subunit D